MTSTSPRTRSLSRNCAKFTVILSGADWRQNLRIGNGRAFSTIKPACGEPWRSNPCGPQAGEAGSCQSGSAIYSPTRHPRSPKARDRGHPHQDRIHFEIMATRRQTQKQSKQVREIQKWVSRRIPVSGWGIVRLICVISEIWGPYSCLI
jgi:hypothetical protein